MKNVRLALIALGILFAALLVYYIASFVIGIVASLLFYGVVLGALTLAGAAAYKFLTKPERLQLENNKADRELADAEKVLAEYRRKALSEKK